MGPGTGYRESAVIVGTSLAVPAATFSFSVQEGNVLSNGRRAAVDEVKTTLLMD